MLMNAGGCDLFNKIATIFDARNLLRSGREMPRRNPTTRDGNDSSTPQGWKISWKHRCDSEENV